MAYIVGARAVVERGGGPLWSPVRLLTVPLRILDTALALTLALESETC